MTCATSVRVISITGASAVTVTDSCSVCRLIVTSRCSASPIVIVMSRYSAFANPASSATSSYRPGGTPCQSVCPVTFADGGSGYASFRVAERQRHSRQDASLSVPDGSGDDAACLCSRRNCEQQRQQHNQKGSRPHERIPHTNLLPLTESRRTGQQKPPGWAP